MSDPAIEDLIESRTQHNGERLSAYVESLLTLSKGIDNEILREAAVIHSLLKGVAEKDHKAVDLFKQAMTNDNFCLDQLPDIAQQYEHDHVPDDNADDNKDPVDDNSQPPSSDFNLSQTQEFRRIIVKLAGCITLVYWTTVLAHTLGMVQIPSLKLQSSPNNFIDSLNDKTFQKNHPIISGFVKLNVLQGLSISHLSGFHMLYKIATGRDCVPMTLQTIKAWTIITMFIGSVCFGLIITNYKLTMTVVISAIAHFGLVALVNFYYKPCLITPVENKSSQVQLLPLKENSESGANRKFSVTSLTFSTKMITKDDLIKKQNHIRTTALAEVILWIGLFAVYYFDMPVPQDMSAFGLLGMVVKASSFRDFCLMELFSSFDVYLASWSGRSCKTLSTILKIGMVIRAFALFKCQNVLNEVTAANHPYGYLLTIWMMFYHLGIFMAYMGYHLYLQGAVQAGMD